MKLEVRERLGYALLEDEIQGDGLHRFAVCEIVSPGPNEGMLAFGMQGGALVNGEYAAVIDSDLAVAIAVTILSISYRAADPEVRASARADLRELLDLVP